ncbi:hypothetical protein HG536_0B00740 [Torulaspora globosa]|uniref:PSP1 C-terminal domain-containing protein n=1 Tax=Torulaspora globosa TaxID=48254 RepID=A0A7G3ZCH7_9SACH|nr:uncharacterized protein HG536_0B00740 [Torulaspora globosa]QLL31213.1 hypothetical protein HG536_0B00740 [Torulaspora globosa]
MTAELPSINSTTSISDNVDLRNYYDNLLFKNGSGKSLTDLPRKAAAAASGVPPSGKSAHALSNEVMAGSEAGNNEKGEKKIDFITGFENAHGMRSVAAHGPPFTSLQMTPSNSEPIPLSATPPLMSSHGLLRPSQQSFFNVSNQTPVVYQSSEPANVLPFSFNFDRNNEQQAYYSNNLAQGFTSNSMMPPMGSSQTQFVEQQQANLQGDLLLPQGQFHSQQPHSGTRRSSYISDTLIHGHLGSLPNPETVSAMNGQVMKPAGFSASASEMAPPTTAPAAPYKNMIPQHYPPRRNTQPVSSIGSSTMPFSPPHLANSNVRNRYLSHSKQQQQPHHAKPLAREDSKGEVLLENGLLLVNAHQIVSSPDLQALYADCGGNYFSSRQVYEFADRIKSMMRPTNGSYESKKSQAIAKFLTFLKSCNLNYNPQSDAFMSEKRFSKSPIERKAGLPEDSNHGGKQSPPEKRSGSTSSYLHYKPLVLVALKNGKLELLSTPQNTNILMKRDDLVIIDGDRGKDLALVVEPSVDLDLALFINFLKKKIHFDSLITTKSQHHANGTFIEALIDSTKGQNEILNSKLYDVIELTQLIVPSKQVLRFATPWEVTTNLHNKFQDELKALHIAQLKLKSLNSGFSHHHHSVMSNGAAPAGQPANRPQLNIKILNAEFQFDRKKLTFYYVCEERNDFRELIKELFKFYKTRIWLCAIPNNLGIDAKYYDAQRKELKMYQDMMQHYATDDLADANAQQGGGFIIAPPLNKIELDNFQIGVYNELVDELFSS